MQVAHRTAGQTPPVKIYNAVYSSVQVYECMVRGIAVMRRRSDSYVNATQILKVAGVDKGRRTKILEKEILPGKHEIVQGGYGKYQGTWIPLERGRDIALQYGVAPLLAPLFDFQPMTNTMTTLPNSLPPVGTTASPRPVSASSSFSSLGAPAGFQLPQHLQPPPIMPGSALRLLTQGRAQGLFTPSTSTVPPARGGAHPSPGGSYFPGGYPGSPFQSVSNAPSPTPPPSQGSLKRAHSEVDGSGGSSMPYSSQQTQSTLAMSPDIHMADGSRPPSTASHRGEEGGPSPAKRPRKEPTPPYPPPSNQRPTSRAHTSTPQPPNGLSRPSSSTGLVANGKPHTASQSKTPRAPRFASKPSTSRNMDPTVPLKDTRRAAIIASICTQDDPAAVLDLLHEIPPDNPGLQFDPDLILDEQGHTALHLAASLGRQRTVQALITSGADVNRGNYNGETPLIRASLATHNYDQRSFDHLVSLLYDSIYTLDTARKSPLHHMAALAGVKGRLLMAKYYLEQTFMWIAQRGGGDFKAIVDLQDEHGDTALNIAARVGSRALVRILLDVGANRILPNKLGLRPGDFGVEVEELGGGVRAEDILSSLRTGPPLPVQKSQDVIADMTTMIQSLSTEFTTEIKSKQDALDVTQAHLRAATRELSEQRKQIQHWQSRCAELDQVGQRARNLEKALEEEEKFDYTGRTDLNGRDARPTAGPAFQWRGQNSTMAGLGGSVDLSFNLDVEPPIPTTDSVQNLIRLRRMKLWHQRMESLLEARLHSLRGVSAEKEFQCKKVVALCTSIPLDKVDSMLDDLVTAMESESQIVDIGRVSGFMQKVRDGII
ncbi:hypothetical protein JAAARDRAFT_150648 [Jaapia argillacea MUCL 33604]|uniref:HTH APSES-type domain-containing protein n=1 Tax=Jaapia argillacea MUCL 33604 TaxID=933084 RepID=A0A067QE03_9AGAM|nr:hypothetical protein JAAARDRAFT_150648 [Jaapia argillacea MUCL 33604]